MTTTQQMKFRYVEFFLLFVVLPFFLAIPIPLSVRLGVVALGLVYVVILFLKHKLIVFQFSSDVDWGSFAKYTMLKFIVIALITTFSVYYFQPNLLFCVPMHKPVLFVVILLVYTFLSVWPQEVLYRTFFFKRYEALFKNKRVLIFTNALLFCLAHLFFRNALVLLLTFIGGLLFAYTYIKTRSTLLVTIEHSIYGNWLFTVGMGEMLAFPGQEACV